MKKRRKLLELRPTQFAVGMLEVDEKIATLSTYSKKKLKDFVDSTPVPAVLSPQGELCVVDHHHFLVVCYHLGIKKVRVEVVEDLSEMKMSYQQFWKWMSEKRNMYPFCQFGEGPRSALYLPRDIRGLADDPYRSLAWYVRKAGAFENSDRNFAEFQWANFFRKKGLLDERGLLGMPEALLEAVRLAQTPEAKHLPGFELLNLEQKIRMKAKARKKAKAIPKIAR